MGANSVLETQTRRGGGRPLDLTGLTGAFGGEYGADAHRSVTAG